jgi:menaquinone-dependent protoporphyrinogen oxidase
MSRVLIVYSTTDGQTTKICNHIQAAIQQSGDTVIQKPIDKVIQEDLFNADKIVIGASIRYGKHSKLVYSFIEQYHEILAAKNNAFFSVSLVARKPEKRSAQTNPYVKKFLKQIKWQPQEVAVFAGRINYPLYGFLDRHIIRLIMLITKGPTDFQSNIEFTDWNQVNGFTDKIISM